MTAKSNRREFLHRAAAGAAGMALPSLMRPAAAAATERPNIVLIMADDLGYECLGCYGGTSYLTPNLDALAASGLRFGHAYCTPLCTPTRVQIMTGLYPFRTGWKTGIWTLPDNQQSIDARKLKTFGHILRDAGYATAVAGKWQLNRFDLFNPDHPKDCGFDDYCLWTWRYGGTNPSRYWDPSVWQDGKLRQDLAGQYGPDVYADFLIDFITRNQSRPFLAYYPMALTHLPLHDTPDLRANPGQFPSQFAAMVNYMDKLVGRIVVSLTQLGLRERTLVLFTGDNGTPSQITSMLGDIPIKGGKNTMTDPGTHVPLIANWPGTVPAGVVSEDLVDVSDILPTLAEVAGVPIPDKAPVDVGRTIAGSYRPGGSVPVRLTAVGTDRPALDGRSFAPQLRGEAGRPREWVFCERGNERYVREKRWRLHEDSILFDMETDPWENNPIAPADPHTPEAAAARARLQAVLDELQ